jgi:hypothetical protein
MPALPAVPPSLAQEERERSYQQLSQWFMADRRCNSYRSVIRLGPGKVSGVADRLTHILLMGSLANSLCARVEPAPPCTSLMQFLAGDDFDPKTQWERYVDFRVADGSNLFDPPSSHAMHDRVTIDWSSATGEDFMASYAAAAAAVKAGKDFEWNVLTDYHEVPGPLGNLKEGDLQRPLLQRLGQLQDVTLQPASRVQEAVGRFHANFALKPREYLTLHIRRKDASHLCDTSISQVRQYVVCSLNRMGFSGAEKKPIVLLTDETDAEYIASLTETLTESLGGRRVIHGDEGIKGILKAEEMDEPLVFMTGLMVRMQSMGELLMDRTSCETCSSPLPRNMTLTDYVLEHSTHLSAKAAEDFRISASPAHKYITEPACDGKAYNLISRLTGNSLDEIKTNLQKYVK